MFEPWAKFRCVYCFRKTVWEKADLFVSYELSCHRNARSFFEVFHCRFCVALQIHTRHSEPGFLTGVRARFGGHGAVLRDVIDLFCDRLLSEVVVRGQTV